MPMVKESGKLKGRDIPLYERLLELAESLPPGTPMPPVNLLKRNFGVGYTPLNRALRALESDGKIIIKERKGVFAVRGGGLAPAAAEKDRQGLKFSAFAVKAPPLSLAVCSGVADGTWRGLAELYNSRLAPESPRVELVTLESSEFRGTAADPGSFDILVMPKPAHDSPPGENFLDIRAYSDALKTGAALRKDIWAGRGPVRSAPAFMSAMVMALHRKTFERRGLDPADAGTPGGVLKICGASGKDFAPGNIFVFHGYMSWFFRFGSPFLTNGAEFVFDLEKAGPALDFLRRIHDGRFSPLCSESYRVYEEGGPLLSGPAMAEIWPGEIRGGIEDYVFAPAPVAGTGVNPLFSADICVSAETVMPEEALAFVRFVLSDEGQRVTAKSCGCLPAAAGLKPADMPEELVSALEVSVSRSGAVYDGCPVLYDARFIVEMLTERFVKGEIDAGKLKQEIESRCARFINNLKK
jgi:hypothetical protein